MELVNVLTGGHDDNAVTAIRWYVARTPKCPFAVERKLTNLLPSLATPPAGAPTGCPETSSRIRA